MPQVPVFNLEGKQVDTIDLNDKIFAAPIKEVAIHQAAVRQLANRLDQDARRGFGWRRQALAPERHWPRPPGQHSCPAVAAWRRRLRAASA